MKKYSLYIIILSAIVMKGFSQEKLVMSTINKNIKMYTPTTLYRIDGVQALGQFGNDIAPKAVYVGPNERTVLTVSEIYDTVGFYQPGYTKKKSIKRDINVEKSFYRSSILAYSKEVKFYQDEIKTINKKQFIVFEVEGTQEIVSKSGEPYEKKYYRYLQYCFVKNKKYIFNFSCPHSEMQYWKDNIRTIMDSVKIK